MFAKWLDEERRFSFAFEDNGGVKISQEEHADLMAGVTAGKILTADKNGNPILQDPAAPTYAELRAREYPPLTDYLDGLVKGDQAQIDAYLDACRQVKARFPK